MDEKGFEEFLETQTSSEAVITFTMEILKHFEYTQKTFFELNDIDDAEDKHLLSFGEWLSEEKVVDKYISAYSRYVGQYYEYTNKPELVLIAKNRFIKKEKEK